MSPIAVIGMACRFPGAHDSASFWSLLRDGGDAVTEVPGERWDAGRIYDPQTGALGKIISRWGGFLPEVDRFDAAFFGITPREMTSMDPQQRVVLEVAWSALEDAGVPPTRLAGSRTGVFVGASTWDYNKITNTDLHFMEAHAGTGSLLCIIANRLSYFLNLRGPSMVVDTACSSSLVALHLACQSLRLGESDLALAGGVNLILSPETTVVLSQAQALSPSGRCRTFDESADGYVRSEGCGIVVLKRLEEALTDGDRILGVIRGSAVNQDGLSNGLTAPNGPAQQAVIREALAQGGLAPEAVGYVEAHGTGTRLGDPIEVAALAAVLMERRPAGRPCGLGSVKTNIGHAEAAAGIAGLIKVLLSLQYGLIPPHLHLRRLNPYIAPQLANSQFFIPADPRPWPATEVPRVAGVSSFGFGGTNAHVVVQEAPVSAGAAAGRERPLHLLPVSAKSKPALRQLAARYATYLRSAGETPLGDICFTAGAGRVHFRDRIAAVGATPEELARALESAVSGVAPGAEAAVPPKAPKIAFLFSGQGAQYAGMGRELYDTQPLFRETLDQCEALLRPHLEKSLRSLLWGEDTALLNQTRYTQPALFALQYGLTRVWRSWGLRPDCVLGHSLGEYGAACAAGVLGLEDALRLVCARGRLMQERTPAGGMVAALASWAAVQPLVQACGGGELELAADNAPGQVAVAGPLPALQALTKELAARGIECKALAASHAFHSHLMEPMLAPFAEVVRTAAFHPATVGIVDNVTGGLAGTRMGEPDYWIEQVRAPVRFAAGVRTLAAQGVDVYVEIGPDATLIGLGQQCLAGAEALWLPSLRAVRGAWTQMLESLARAYVRGADPDWQSFDRGYSRRRVSLPLYPFQRHRHWFDVKGPLPPVFMQESTAADAEISSKERVVASSAPDRASDRRERGATGAERLLEIIAAVGQLPAGRLTPESRLREHLGFDSLMLMELRTKVGTTFPALREASTKLFHEDPTIQQVLDFVSDGAPASDEQAVDLSPALAVLRRWRQTGKRRSRRIHRKWVHRTFTRNVFIASVERIDRNLVVGEVVQDPAHPFFYEHPQDHVPGMYLAEAVRQFAIAVCHMCFDVPLGMRFVLNDMRLQFFKFAEIDRPLYLVFHGEPPTADGRATAHLESTTYVVQDDEIIGEVTGRGLVSDSGHYATVRAETERGLDRIPRLERVGAARSTESNGRDDGDRRSARE